MRLIPFSSRQRLTFGAWLEDDTLMLHGRPICRRQDVKLRGNHNISNLLAAAAISHAAGADLDTIRRVAQTFAGVPHRLEVVAQANGITWINDSIATSPERAIAGCAVSAGEQTLILLAGAGQESAVGHARSRVARPRQFPDRFRPQRLDDRERGQGAGASASSRSLLRWCSA